MTFLLVAITEYYTGTRWRPVKAIAEASQTGHATNIIAGLAVGMQATALPVIVIAVGIVGSFYAAGESLYGIGVAVMAQLSMTGLIVALDAYGPVTDNAGGIAEMADLDESVRGDHRPAGRGRQHDEGRDEGLRDRLRRSRGARSSSTSTSAASARTASTSFFSLDDPWVIAGLFIGGLMPFLFASLAMQAVGASAARSSRRCAASSARTPGSWRDLAPGLLARGRASSRRSAIRLMLAPALIPIAVPDRRRDHQPEMLGGLLIGTIVTGLFLAIAMTSGGGAWDNAKKLIEDGALRRQGLGGPRRGGHR